MRSLRLDFLFLTSKGYPGNNYDGIRHVISHHLYWLDLHKLRIDGLDWIGEHFLRDGVTFIRDLWCVGCKNYETADTVTELLRSSTGLVRFIFETNASDSLVVFLGLPSSAHPVFPLQQRSFLA